MKFSTILSLITLLLEKIISTFNQMIQYKTTVIEKNNTHRP